jgi:hypothetical protein
MENLLEYKKMGVGVKILIYAYLIMIIYITFVNLREMNKNMSNDNEAKLIKLSKIGFLFYKANNKNINFYYLKIVIIEIILYVLIICMIIAFVISLHIEDKDCLIIYCVLWMMISSLGIYTGRKSIRKN